MHKPLLILLFVLFAFVARAGKPVPKPVVKNRPQIVKYDSTAVKVREFDQKALDAYRNDKAFAYSEEDIEKGLSFWERLWKGFWRFIDSLFRRKGGPVRQQSPSALQYLLIGAAVIGLVFVIIKLIGGDLANIFGRESKAISLSYTESLENIHEITFDEEIEKALIQRNYKLAVRLLYLSCLKQLNDAQLIYWQIEKTNAAYVDELSNGEQRQSFSVLTRQFEYVWYGDFPVDGQSYQNINTLFMDFKKMLP